MCGIFSCDTSMSDKCSEFLLKLHIVVYQADLYWKDLWVVCALMLFVSQEALDVHVKDKPASISSSVSPVSRVNQMQLKEAGKQCRDVIIFHVSVLMNESNLYDLGFIWFT